MFWAHGKLYLLSKHRSDRFTKLYRMDAMEPGEVNPLTLLGNDSASGKGAAFASMVAMVEVTTRALVDTGMKRARAIRIVGAVGFTLGIPSALSMQVFNNQDWIWGVALMLTGLFLAISIISHGVGRFRREHLNHEDSDVTVGRWWDFVIGVLVPPQAVFLLVWFLYTSWRESRGLAQAIRSGKC